MNLRDGLSLVACCLVFGSFVGSSASSQELRWRSGGALRLQRASERPARSVLAERLVSGGARHALVRFERALSERERELWAAAGVHVKSALGEAAYFAQVTSTGFDAERAARLPGLVDVREIELAWKLHPLLLAGETPAWTVVDIDGQGEPTVAVYVLLHEGVALERGDALLRGLGGGVLDALESVNGLVALVPRSRIGELASADPVLWVEPALPRMEEVWNDSNRALVQADLLQAAPYGLDGSGVKVLVYDAGSALSSHVDFGGRLTVRDASGTISHATHVAGTIGGSGAASGGTFRGMAPAVTIESYGFEYDGSGVFFFTNPGDFEDDYDEAINVHGVDIANNSIGSNVESNGFHCPIQGDYGVICTLIDGVVRGSLGTPFRVVWANGNERTGTRCDVESTPGYYSTAPPATAKNHITVGAVNSNDDSIAYFSSWGPTDDGRLKPDISAPGCQSNGDGGVTSSTATSNTSYAAFCGTSMASPTTCGVAALILEDFRAQFGPPDPLNSTLKVLLAHTAAERGNAGPDYQFGYGSIRAKDAIDFMRLGNFREGSLLEQGDHARWSVTVGGGDPELRLTLAWDDAPATPNVFGSLVNDLDLVVRDPLGAQHHVWTLDPLAPSLPAVRTGPDRVNNIEQVRVTAPMAGTWQVEVRGFEVPEGPQSFSLASSHALVDGPFVSISFPSDLPIFLASGASVPVTARIIGVNDTLVGGSPTLHVRYNGGSFLAFPMSALGGDLYQADLPPPVCTATPEFYFSAAGVASGTATSPAGAPGAVHAALVADLATVFADDFETNQGWTVVNVSLLDGPWERAVPAGGGTRGDPLNDFDGSGNCFLTDNVVGNSDVDDGPTRLVSPTFDLSVGDEFEVSYARWFTNDDNDIDSMLVEISANNGANWTSVETVKNAGGWVQTSFLVGDFIAPTNQVKLRFSVVDNPNDSVTEAGLDAFRIERRTCALFPDCNLNGIVDADDIASGRSLDVNDNGVPDECGPFRKFRQAGPPTQGF